MQDASSEVAKIYLSLKLRGFVDDITPLVKGRNVEVAKKAKKGDENAERRKWRKQVSSCQSLKMAKEGKSKVIASCGFLENELSQFSKEGVTLAESVETLGVDLRTRIKTLGAKEKTRRRKCKVRFSIIKKNKAFQKNYNEKWAPRYCYVQA